MESQRSRQWKAWIDSICQEHQVSTKKSGRFEPNPDDAFKLAALQWWTHEIGRILIEVYATDRRQFDRMSMILSDSRAALRSLAGGKKLMADGDACSTDQDCPRGFFCDEGTCEPLDATGPSST
jgi:hypothetical protein